MRHGAMGLLCAWVLWAQQTDLEEPTPGAAWVSGWRRDANPIAATASRQECEQKLSDIVAANKARGAGGGEDVVWWGNKSYSWRCLPDTVDPRGPKR